MNGARAQVLKMEPLLAALGGLGAGLVVFVVASMLSPKLALGAVLGTGVMVAIFLDPRIGFLITALVVPLERFGRFTDDLSMVTVSLMRVIGVVTLGAFFVHAMVRKWRIRFGLAFWLYFLYTAFALLSITYSSDFMGSVRAWGQIIGNLLFLFLVINVVRSYELGRTGVTLWLAATVIIALYTTYDWHFGDVRLQEAKIGLTEMRWHAVHVDSSEWEESLTGIRRAIGSTSHAAVYGINLLLTLPFFALLLCKRNLSWKWRVVLFFCVLLILYNILLTNTRAVILCCVLVIGLMLVRRLLVLRLPAILACLLVGVVALPFFEISIFERVLELRNYTYQKSSTLRIRLAYWNAGLRVIEDHWLFGIGIGNKNEIPRALRMERVPERTSVHNEYIQTFMELGLLGFLIHFWFVFLLLYYSFRGARLLKEYDDDDEKYWFLVACQIAMLTVLVYGLQCDVFRFPLKTWWLVAGLTVVMYRYALDRFHAATRPGGAKREVTA